MALTLFGSKDQKAAAPSAASDLIKDTTTQAFVHDVIEASRDVPVLVDFWAPWCGPCKMIAPVLEEMAREQGGKLLVAKVNTDEYFDRAIEYGVQGIPTLLFFANGQEVDRQVGAGPTPALKARVEDFLERAAQVHLVPDGEPDQVAGSGA
jgi:thioredoxin